MHSISALSVVLAGASVLSLASAQDSSQPSDATSVLTSTALGTTTTETATSSPASQTSSQPNPFPEDSPEEVEEAKRLAAACYPFSNNQIDWEAPCPAVQIIQAECTWGPEAGKQLRDMLSKSLNGEEPTAGISEDWEQQPLDVQRACLCSSSFAEMVLGCGACLEGHGAGPSELPTYWATSNATAVQEFTKLYCKADVEITDDIGMEAFDILLGQSEDYSGSTSSSSSVSATATASDRLGTATDVSLYFTPSVSSAYTVDMPTASSSADQTQHANAWYTYTSLSTSDGLIVPTAFNAERVTASPPAASGSDANATASGGSTATAAAGAMQTAMVHSGLGAGALGLAALAFAL